MFLAVGIVLFIISVAIMFAIIFTTIRTIKNRGELVISKKNLIYFVPTFLLIYSLHLSAWVFNGESLGFFQCFGLFGSVLDVVAKFKTDTDLVMPICMEYPVFYAAFVLAYVSGGATVILSIASFFSPRVRNYVSYRHCAGVVISCSGIVPIRCAMSGTTRNACCS